MKAAPAVGLEEGVVVELHRKEVPCGHGQAVEILDLGPRLTLLDLPVLPVVETADSPEAIPLQDPCNELHDGDFALTDDERVNPLPVLHRSAWKGGGVGASDHDVRRRVGGLESSCHLDDRGEVLGVAVEADDRVPALESFERLFKSETLGGRIDHVDCAASAFQHRADVAQPQRGKDQVEDVGSEPALGVGVGIDEADVPPCGGPDRRISGRGSRGVHNLKP